MITITSFVARNFLVLCLTGSRDDVGLVYFNKENPRLVFCSNLWIKTEESLAWPLAQLLSAHAIGAGGLGLKSRVG